MTKGEVEGLSRLMNKEISENVGQVLTSALATGLMTLLNHHMSALIEPDVKTPAPEQGKGNGKQHRTTRRA